MRVLHVIPSVSLHDGGPSVAIRGMARALAARGVDVTVATTDADGSGSLDVPLDAPVLDNGVEYRHFRRGAPRGWKFSWPLTRWLARHVREYDVVHVHALFSYATIPGCRLAARAGVPYVLRPLGTLDPWSLSHRSWKKRPYYALVERAHVRRAAALHATSVDEAAALRALPDVARVALVPLGVDGAEGRARANPGARAERTRFLFLSRLHPVKNVPLLIEAFAAAARASERPIELIVAGDGEASYVSLLAEQARARGVAEQIRFAGRVEGDEKRALLASAHAFVLPSAHENFGIAVAEAMAAGLPVIVTEAVGLASDVRESDAGLVVAPDPAALAGAIRELASDPERRRRMGSAGSALVAARYSWDACGAGLEALYRELASGNPRVRGAGDSRSEGRAAERPAPSNAGAAPPGGRAAARRAPPTALP